MIRLEYRKSENSKSESGGWLRGLRYVAVSPIAFPESLSQDHVSLDRLCRIVHSFVESCAATLALVRDIADELFPLAVVVVRQYLLVVCLRFERWAAERVQHDDDAAELTTLREGIRKLQGELEEAGQQPAAALRIEHAADAAA